MVLAVGRLAAVAVAAQVGHDHRVALAQPRRDLVPLDVRLRGAVHQQQRRTAAADHVCDRRAGGLNALASKAGEQVRALRSYPVRHHRADGGGRQSSLQELTAVIAHG